MLKVLINSQPANSFILVQMKCGFIQSGQIFLVLAVLPVSEKAILYVITGPCYYARKQNGIFTARFVYLRLYSGECASLPE